MWYSLSAGKKLCIERKCHSERIGIGMWQFRSSRCIDANGKTIAVVASGLNIVHPKANESLQKEIINKGGLIISEQPLAWKPILYGICPQPTASSFGTKVIVVQCAVKSGTMNTVYFAHKYGCKIYAVAYGQYDKHNAGNEYILNKGIGFPIKL